MQYEGGCFHYEGTDYYQLLLLLSSLSLIKNTHFFLNISSFVLDKSIGHAHSLTGSNWHA